MSTKLSSWALQVNMSLLLQMDRRVSLSDIKVMMMKPITFSCNHGLFQKWKSKSICAQAVQPWHRHTTHFKIKAFCVLKCWSRFWFSTGSTWISSFIYLLIECNVKGTSHPKNQKCLWVCLFVSTTSLDGWMDLTLLTVPLTQKSSKLSRIRPLIWIYTKIYEHPVSPPNKIKINFGVKCPL